jgi:arsenate reductase-like glutaredoxin family protein
LQAQGAELEEREYGKNPLTEAELNAIIGDGPVTEFLNTRTPLYRERKMKDNPPSKKEAIQLMLKDQNLLRRPVVIKGKSKIAGFDEAVLKELLENATGLS